VCRRGRDGRLAVAVLRAVVPELGVVHPLYGDERRVRGEEPPVRLEPLPVQHAVAGAGDGDRRQPRVAHVHVAVRRREDHSVDPVRVPVRVLAGHRAAEGVAADVPSLDVAVRDIPSGPPLSEDGEVQQLFEALTEAWLRGDLDRLVELSEANPMLANADTNSAFEHRVIDERNKRMAKRMQPLLNKGGAFVAIGALHLPGEEGVLALLTEAGYSVRAAR